MLRILKFETRYHRDKSVDWVLLAPAGEAMERSQTWQRVDKMDPARVREDRREGESYDYMRERWALIEPAYQAWKQNNEIPETGTPLAAWSGVTEQQAKIMRAVDLRTVEDVAEATESTIQKLPFPNARILKKLAADYLGGRDAADSAEKLAEAEARIAAMEEMIAEMAAAKAEPVDKPRRGRPPKAQADESEAA